MKRFPFFVCLVFLLLLIPMGIVSASETTTTTLARIGSNISFETSPTGATIWLDNINIGTSPFTYYTEKNGNPVCAYTEKTASGLFRERHRERQ